MAEGIAFENELEAETAFELGSVNFKCGVCGCIHRSGSKASYRCFRKLKNRVASYAFRFPFWSFNLIGSCGIWRYWGREKELIEYEALRECIYGVLNVKELARGIRDLKYHMLALPEGWVRHLNQINLTAAHERAREIMNGPFKQLSNRLLQVDRIFEEARGPNLSFPFVVDFKDLGLSFDGSTFISFQDFFWPRIERAAQLIKDEELQGHINRFVLSEVYRKMTTWKVNAFWELTQVGYFLPDGAYLATVHDGIREEFKDYSGGGYKCQTYCLFYLDGYERPELMEVLVEEICLLKT